MENKIINVFFFFFFFFVQQQGITWATPGALHSPALLTAQNPPIFIRGPQQGQENVFISNPQPAMHVPNCK